MPKDKSLHIIKETIRSKRLGRLSSAKHNSVIINNILIIKRNDNSSPIFLLRNLKTNKWQEKEPIFIPINAYDQDKLNLINGHGGGDALLYLKNLHTINDDQFWFPNIPIFIHSHHHSNLHQALQAFLITETSRQIQPESLQDHFSLLQLIIARQKKFTNHSGSVKHLIKSLWAEVLNRQVAGPIAGALLGRSTLHNYCRIARQTQTFLHLRQESPNLIPFIITSKEPPYLSMLSKENLNINPQLRRHILRQPYNIIRTWSNHGKHQTMELHRLLTQNHNFPSFISHSIMKFLCRDAYYIFSHINSNPKTLARLFRLLGQVINDKIKQDEADLKALSEDTIKIIRHAIDWYRSHITLANPLPDKNFTPAALLRHMELWDEQKHNRSQEETNRQIEKNKSLAVHIDYLINDLEIDGYQFSALDTPEKITAESLEMKHCVENYWERIFYDDYRCFKVITQEGNRATLGIAFTYPKAQYDLDQFNGPKNSKMSNKDTLMALIFMDKYNAALRESNSKLYKFSKEEQRQIIEAALRSSQIEG